MLDSPSDCRARNVADFRRGFNRHISAFDSCDALCYLSGVTNFRTSELHAAFHCRVNALTLPFPDVCPFRFGNERKELQDEIGDKFSDQSVCLVCRIKERHVEDADVHTFDFDEDPPLLEDVLVVPAETVKRLDDYHVS